MPEPVPHPALSLQPQAAAGRRERRASPRARVGYLRCGLPAPAVILNVSRQGLRIESFRPYRRGDRVLVNSTLAGRPRRIAGDVRWCRQIATAGKDRSLVYHVGIALETSLEEQGLAALLDAESRVPAPGSKPAASEG